MYKCSGCRFPIYLSLFEIFSAVMTALVGLSACSETKCDKSVCLSLAMPVKWFYVQARLSGQPKKVNPEEQSFGKLVRKFLFCFALIGLMGFEYRNFVWPKYNALQPLGELSFKKNKLFFFKCLCSPG